MWVSVDLCVIPVGVGISLSPYIKACIRVIKEHKLEYSIGPNGTAIEGEWNEVFECIRKCHEVLHINGAQRVFTLLKVNTRTDKKQLLKDKVESIMDV